MILNVFVDGQNYPVEVPQFVLDDGEEFFRQIDADMDKGYQMSRSWVEKPDVTQRCRIAADRILTALHTHNERVSVMMAGYILSRLPDVTGVRLDTAGDMCEHELIVGPKAV